MKPKDYIDKKAKEEALKAFGATQLNNNQETSPYFVGKISADRKKITDPTGREYDLIFTGNPKQYELAQRLSDSKAVVNAQVGAKMNVDGNIRDLHVIYPEVSIVNNKHLIFNYILKNTKNKLYNISTSVFGNSELYGNSVNSYAVQNPVITQEARNIFQFVGFSPDGKSIWGYSVLFQWVGDTSLKETYGPFEICWFVGKNYTLSSKGDVEFSSVDSGSYIFKIEDFSGGIQAVGQYPEGPPNYTLVGNDGGTPYHTNYFMTINPAYLISGRASIPYIYYSGESILALVGIGSIDIAGPQFIYKAPPDIVTPTSHTTYIPTNWDVGANAIAENTVLVNLTTGEKTFITSYSLNYDIIWDVVTTSSINPITGFETITVSTQAFTFPELSGVPSNYRGHMLGPQYSVYDREGDDSSFLSELQVYFTIRETYIIVSRMYQYIEDISIGQIRWDDRIYDFSGNLLFQSLNLTFLLEASSNNNFAPLDAVFAVGNNRIFTYKVFGEAISPGITFPKFYGGLLLSLKGVSSGVEVTMITLKQSSDLASLVVTDNPEDIKIKLFKINQDILGNLTYNNGAPVLFPDAFVPINETPYSLAYDIPSTGARSAPGTYLDYSIKF